MVTRLRIENNGKTVNLTNKLPKGYLKENGASGFGVSPTTLTINEGALEGGWWRSTKRGPRDITLPIVMMGGSEVELRSMMRELVAVLGDRNGPAKLYATYETGEEFFTNVHYAGGADHVYGQDTNGVTFLRWVLTLRSPSPYWTSTESVNFSLGNENTGRGLIKATSLTKLQLSSSSAIGSIRIFNPGDVEAYPVWLFGGPATGVTVSMNGRGFSYNAAISGPNPVTVDTQQKTVVDSSGVNRYGNLGPAPKLFPIPPGESVIDILMPGTDALSAVLFNFQPRYEAIL